MKTFDELQKGDYIYYWDHGKLHKQLIHNIENTEQISEYIDWFGKKQIVKRPYIKIEAGRGTILELFYKNTSTIIRQNYLLRFSCLEAANQWIFQQKVYYETKIKYLEYKMEKYKRIKNNYCK